MDLFLSFRDLIPGLARDMAFSRFYSFALNGSMFVYDRFNGVIPDG